MNFQQPRHIRRDGGNAIAYHKSEGKSPGVVFLCGYQSDMTGTKVIALEAACRTEGRAFLRFDYSGHGVSQGAFEDLVLSDWVADALAVLDQCTDGPQVLVGSSMGAWIMVLTALARPERVAGLVGFAPGPDFTEDLLWGRATDEDRATLMRDGIWRRPIGDGGDEFVVTRALIEDGRKHLVLRGPIPIHVPVRLLHGTKDESVPWTTPERLQECLESDDVVLTPLEGADHRMSKPEEMGIVVRTVTDLCHHLEVTSP